MHVFSYGSPGLEMSVHFPQQPPSHTHSLSLLFSRDHVTNLFSTRLHWGPSVMFFQCLLRARH